MWYGNISSSMEKDNVGQKRNSRLNTWILYNKGRRIKSQGFFPFHYTEMRYQQQVISLTTPVTQIYLTRNKIEMTHTLKI